MTTAILVSTYNSPKYLNLCLKALARQTKTPDEIVIADDGSGEPTRKLINEYRDKLSCPLFHVWHPDKGFRKSAILNKGIARCNSEYIIQIDGDIVAEKHFVEDHVRYAREGFFYAGSRGLLSEKEALKCLDSGNIDLGCFAKGMQHPFNMVRLPWLSPLLFRERNSRGCNIAYWRKDAIAINGYDERFEGIGAEDTDFDERLERSGVKRRHLKLCAVAFHLWHPTRTAYNDNDALLFENRKNNTIISEKGIKEHLQV